MNIIRKYIKSFLILEGKGINVPFDELEDYVENDIRDYVWNNKDSIKHNKKKINIDEFENTEEFEKLKSIPEEDLFYYQITMPVASLSINIFVFNDTVEDIIKSSGMHSEVQGLHVIDINLFSEDIDYFLNFFNKNSKDERVNYVWNHLRKHITNILLHEYTHALEPREEKLRKINNYDHSIVDTKEYYSIPQELNAHSNELIYLFINHMKANNIDIPGNDEIHEAFKDEDISSFLDQLKEIGVSRKNLNLMKERVYTYFLGD